MEQTVTANKRASDTRGTWLEHWPNRQLVNDARVADAAKRRSTKMVVSRMHTKGAIRTFERTPTPDELA